VRIVAGSHRGRVIDAGADRAIRPTADRARQALFDILAHGPEYASPTGALPQGIRVVDAFAGTGALGLEALSRGAAHVTFIEQQTEAALLIRGNAARLGEADQVTILQRDAADPGRATAPCMLAFLDPPYRSGLAGPALIALAANGWLAPNAVIVVELAAADDFAPPAPFTSIESRRYGAAKFVFLKA
jgi:16S rRNA (guanine966-N2)-methyltransferase